LVRGEPYQRADLTVSPESKKETARWHSCPPRHSHRFSKPLSALTYLYSCPPGLAALPKFSCWQLPTTSVLHVCRCSTVFRSEPTPFHTSQGCPPCVLAETTLKLFRANNHPEPLHQDRIARCDRNDEAVLRSLNCAPPVLQMGTSS
jgi:hypothetical protein